MNNKDNLKPLAIDLFCGLGGWTDGLLAEGWDAIGFDIERHDYGTGGYPAQLVLQDILTLHGKQFRNVDLIVASPPCQKYSYMAMPWSRAKQIEREYLDGTRDKADLTALFDACFRIQREACEAAGHFIPMIVENVRGAQKWVGRSKWNYGSFHFWGDIPALMPVGSGHKTLKKYKGNGSFQNCDGLDWRDPLNVGINNSIDNSGIKAPGMNWSDQTKRGQDFTRLAGQNAGVKQPGISGMRENGKGDAWFQDGAARSGSKSKARKAVSAAIAKIPFPVSSYIARIYKPLESQN